MQMVGCCYMYRIKILSVKHLGVVGVYLCTKSVLYLFVFCAVPVDVTNCNDLCLACSDNTAYMVVGYDAAPNKCDPQTAFHFSFPVPLHNHRLRSLWAWRLRFSS